MARFGKCCRVPVKLSAPLKTKGSELYFQTLHQQLWKEGALIYGEESSLFLWASMHWVSIPPVVFLALGDGRRTGLKSIRWQPCGINQCKIEAGWRKKRGTERSEEIVLDERRKKRGSGCLAVWQIVCVLTRNLIGHYPVPAVHLWYGYDVILPITVLIYHLSGKRLTQIYPNNTFTGVLEISPINGPVSYLHGTEHCMLQYL